MRRRSFLQAGLFAVTDATAAHITHADPTCLSSMEPRGSTETTPHFIPRQSRQTGVLVGDGGAIYGPFGNLKIFDTADIVVYLRDENADQFLATTVKVSKVEGLPFDAFTIEFSYNLPATSEFVVSSERIAERSVGVVNGNRIDPTALEEEFSKIATAQQELRRDISRALKAPFGEDPATIRYEAILNAEKFAIEAELSAERAEAAGGDKVFASAVKWYAVRQFGAIGGQPTDGANINAAITFVHNNRGRLQLGTAEYLTEETIVVPKELVMRGNSPLLTVIKATAAAAAAHTPVVKTQHFDDNTGSRTKLFDQEKMTYGIDLRDFRIDGSWNEDWATRSLTAHGGRGLSLYGRFNVIDNVVIDHCSGQGFYTECGGLPINSPTQWWNDTRNIQKNHIGRVDVHRCAYELFVCLGPGDGFIESITGGICGDVNSLGTPINSIMFPDDLISGAVFAAADGSGASGTQEIGACHFHTNWNGPCVRAKGGASVLVRLKADNLIGEGGLTGVLLQSGVYAQIGMLNSRNNIVRALINAENHSDVLLQSDKEVKISLIEIRRSAPNGAAPATSSLRIDQNEVLIGQVDIEGNGQPGNLVEVAENRTGIAIGSIKADNARGLNVEGASSAALYTKAGSRTVVGTLYSRGSDIGWRNASAHAVVKDGHVEVSNAFPSNVAGVQMDVAQDSRVRRRSQLTATSLTGAILYPHGPVVVTGTAAGFDPTRTTEQAVTIAHDCWTAPSLRELSLHIDYNGSVPGTIQYIDRVSVDATNAIFRVKQSAAGAGNTAGGTTLTLLF